MTIAFDRKNKRRANTVTRRTPIALLLAVWLGALTAGCGTPIRVFVHPEADLDYYTKVGVIPFQSMGTDRFAGEKFAIEFTTALFAAEMFEVVDYGIFVNQIVKALGSRTVTDGLSLEELKKIQEATGAEGVFLGTVMQYDMVSSSSGTFPVIQVEARLIDTATGNVVWLATITERGGPKTPIIGIGEIHTLGELSQKVSKKLVSEIK